MGADERGKFLMERGASKGYFSYEKMNEKK